MREAPILEFDFPGLALPSAPDAMRLVERVAMKGIRFPGALVMLSKVMFTLEGMLAVTEQI
jgi:hypothetical protein